MLIDQRAYNAIVKGVDNLVTNKSWPLLIEYCVIHLEQIGHQTQAPLAKSVHSILITSLTRAFLKSETTFSDVSKSDLINSLKPENFTSLSAQKISQLARLHQLILKRLMHDKKHYAALAIAETLFIYCQLIITMMATNPRLQAINILKELHTLTLHCITLGGIYYNLKMRTQALNAYNFSLSLLMGLNNQGCYDVAPGSKYSHSYLYNLITSKTYMIESSCSREEILKHVNSPSFEELPTISTNFLLSIAERASLASFATIPNNNLQTSMNDLFAEYPNLKINNQLHTLMLMYNQPSASVNESYITNSMHLINQNLNAIDAITTDSHPTFAIVTESSTNEHQEDHNPSPLKKTATISNFFFNSSSPSLSETTSTTNFPMFDEQVRSPSC